MQLWGPHVDPGEGQPAAQAWSLGQAPSRPGVGSLGGQPGSGPSASLCCLRLLVTRLGPNTVLSFIRHLGNTAETHIQESPTPPGVPAFPGQCCATEDAGPSSLRDSPFSNAVVSGVWGGGQFLDVRDPLPRSKMLGIPFPQHQTPLAPSHRWTNLQTPDVPGREAFDIATEAENLMLSAHESRPLEASRRASRRGPGEGAQSTFTQIYRNRDS